MGQPYSKATNGGVLLIRDQRIAAGLTLEMLSEMVGCTPQTLQRYETGVRRISFDRLLDIAQALDVPLACLVSGGDGLTDDERDLIAWLREHPRDRVVIEHTLRGLREIDDQ